MFTQAVLTQAVVQALVEAQEAVAAVHYGGSNWADGGGGGRILPGSGGGGGYATAQSGITALDGGSGNGAGAHPGNSCDSDSCGSGGCGGGGWGANGGGRQFGTGLAGGLGGYGGAAITGTSRTLSNSGTIYGST